MHLLFALAVTSTPFAQVVTTPIALAATSTQASLVVELSGDQAWIAPLVPMLSARVQDTRVIQGAEGAKREGRWYVEIQADQDTLRVALTDPDGSTANSVFDIPQGLPSFEMKARAVAAWLTSILKYEVELSWVPKGPERPPPKEPPPKKPPPPVIETKKSSVSVELEGGALGALDGSAVQGGIGISLGWVIQDWVFVRIGALFEPEHEVSGDPLPIRRWSVPLRWTAGLNLDVGNFGFQLGGGVSARFLRLGPEGAESATRFNAGGAVSAGAHITIDRFQVGTRFFLMIWGRRQEIVQGTQIVYQGEFLQGWAGVFVAYRWTIP